MKIKYTTILILSSLAVGASFLFSQVSYPGPGGITYYPQGSGSSSGSSTNTGIETVAIGAYPDGQYLHVGTNITHLVLDSTNGVTWAYSTSNAFNQFQPGYLRVYPIVSNSSSSTITTNMIAPIGSVQAWLKSFAGTPALPSGWVECNGQVLADAASVYNGATLPNLNVGNRFLRGNSTSGGTGGSETHAHGMDSSITVDSGSTSPVMSGSTAEADGRPPYYDVVWIMRVK